MPGARLGVRTLVVEIGARRIEWWTLLGGTIGALYVFVQSLTAAQIGVALFTVGVVAGQSVGGLVVDRIGVAGLPPRAVSTFRIAGAALAIVAVVIASLGRTSGAAAWYLYALPVVSGGLIGLQQALNGRLRRESGSAVAGTLVNFIVSACLLAVAVAIQATFAPAPTLTVSSPFHLLGGLFGLGVVLLQVALVHRLGVLLLSLGLIAGQLVAAIVLDAAWPVGGDELTIQVGVGTAAALVAVAIAAVPTRRTTPR